jgi:hypothetical protein
MTHTCSRVVAILAGIVILPCTGAALAMESCNQVEVAPGSEATISLLLPDVANDLQARLRVRDTHESAPVDAWTVCPVTAPYGTCASPAHADIAAISTRRVVDPGDGMQLVAFRLKNGSKSLKRDVRLCVQYGMP